MEFVTFQFNKWQKMVVYLYKNDCRNDLNMKIIIKNITIKILKF